MKLDKTNIQPLIDKKLVSVQKNPEFDLFIYNYTQKAQFEGIQAWTPELRMCRGLILDKEGNVIARPFDKFFNLEQHTNEELPLCGFKAYDKLDGSLGILYKRPDGKYAIATRGSFVSDQAIEGTKILHEVIGDKDPGFTDDWTVLFEIIYPGNRIVVDYGQERKLILLGGRHIETGSIGLPESFPHLQNFFESSRVVEDYDKPRDNSEGVVLHYTNGFMVKMKYEEYVRLHRLVTGCTARSIWEILKNGTGIKEMIERVPEEFEAWVRETSKRLSQQFNDIMAQTKQDYKEIMSDFVFRSPVDLFLDSPITYLDYVKVHRAMRKELNERFSKKQNPDILAARFENVRKERIAEMVWDRIKPEHETPFKKDIDK